MNVQIRGRPIIGADIKHLYDYRYWPFSKQMCRYCFFFFFFFYKYLQTNMLFTGDIIYWGINNTGEII